VGIAPVLIDRRSRFLPEQVPNGVPVIATLTELIPLVDERRDRASA
jgi:hypothetical protein